LPSKNGYTLLAEFSDSQDLPTIFLSAKEGGNDYMKKPFSMDELLVRMESLLHRFGRFKDIQNLKVKKYTFS
jgi:DNA-binding response OmpR family regulator